MIDSIVEKISIMKFRLLLPYFFLSGNNESLVLVETNQLIVNLQVGIIFNMGSH